MYAYYIYIHIKCACVDLFVYLWILSVYVFSVPSSIVTYVFDLLCDSSKLTKNDACCTCAILGVGLQEPCCLKVFGGCFGDRSWCRGNVSACLVEAVLIFVEWFLVGLLEASMSNLKCFCCLTICVT